MSEIDTLLSQLPTEQIAAQLGTDAGSVDRAARAALPALFGGLQANAADPAGEASILDAVQQHDPSLVEGGVDLDRVDTADGEAIASHIFGGQQDEVVNRLGGVGGDSALVRKLIPILAPIVLSYLMSKLQQQGGLGGQASGGQASGGQGGREGGVLPGIDPAPVEPAAPQAGGSILTDVLGSILGGGTQQQRQPQGSGLPTTGSILTDVLGGLLGGGRR